MIRFYVGKDTFNITEIVISVLAKNGSFGFAHGLFVFSGVRECSAFAKCRHCVLGQKQMCHLCCGNKIGFKKCAVEKK